MKKNVLFVIKSRYKTKTPILAKEIHDSFPENHIYLIHGKYKHFWIAKQILKYTTTTMCEQTEAESF